MNEMIERVAKAIFNDDFPNGSLKWEYATQKPYLKLAKAAIQAMREPTDEMYKAGELAQAQYTVSAQCIYINMIDAALKE